MRLVEYLAIGDSIVRTEIVVPVSAIAPGSTYNIDGKEWPVRFKEILSYGFQNTNGRCTFEIKNVTVERCSLGLRNVTNSEAVFNEKPKVWAVGYV